MKETCIQNSGKLDIPSQSYGPKSVFHWSIGAGIGDVGYILCIWHKFRSVDKIKLKIKFCQNPCRPAGK